MAGITRFEDIEAWRSSRKLTNLIYALGNQAGFNRDFGLRDQIRRAAISVMSNIAEGFESHTDIQFVNFLGMARASAGEVRAHLILHLIKTIFQKNNSRKPTRWQLHVPAKSQGLFRISSQILGRGAYVRMARNTPLTEQPTFDIRLLTEQSAT